MKILKVISFAPHGVVPNSVRDINKQGFIKFESIIPKNLQIFETGVSKSIT